MSVGFLGTLLAHLTPTRAANLDNLDQKLSDYMADKHYYTAGRAALLDKLDETISSRASATNLATVDTVVDAVKVSTDSIKSTVDTNLDAKVSDCATSSDIPTKTQQVITADGTWTRPTGVTQIDILAVGGGGGGGYASSGVHGAGGGGGAIVFRQNVYVSGNLTIVIGDYGAGSDHGGGSDNGSDGDATTVSFASGTIFITAYGGKGGTTVSGGDGGASGHCSFSLTPGGDGCDYNASATLDNDCMGYATAGTGNGAGGGSYTIGGSPGGTTYGRDGSGGAGGYNSADGDHGGPGFVIVSWEA